MSMLAAMLGRLAWLGEKSGQGQRIWTWRLLFELPTAFCMALIGSGIADHFQMGQTTSLGMISALSYLGPRGVIDAVERIMRMRGSKNENH